jgi:hypothetical protein
MPGNKLSTRRPLKLSRHVLRRGLTSDAYWESLTQRNLTFLRLLPHHKSWTRCSQEAVSLDLWIMKAPCRSGEDCHLPRSGISRHSHDP